MARRKIVDRILRFEHLGEDLRAVLAARDLPHSGRIETRTKHGWRPHEVAYQTYYTDETRAQVYARQRRVVEQMGYAF